MDSLQKYKILTFLLFCSIPLIGKESVVMIPIFPFIILHTLIGFQSGFYLDQIVGSILLIGSFAVLLRRSRQIRKIDKILIVSSIVVMYGFIVLALFYTKGLYVSFAFWMVVSLFSFFVVKTLQKIA